jgi:hypothetical protein
VVELGDVTRGSCAGLFLGDLLCMYVQSKSTTATFQEQNTIEDVSASMLNYGRGGLLDGAEVNVCI